jgi:isopentenyl diphosphate isomerase/L-lactate dehydrogenase-like FMN-dependent dehydrogenase
MQAYALAAAGQEGVTHMLGILEAEMRSAMGLMGVTGIDQLNPRYVAPAPVVTPAHEHSAWVNMPGGRIG